MIIAIDGPAGAGKSTIAFEVARRLGFQLIDTGAIYRSLALHARAQDVDLHDGEALARLAATLEFEFQIDGDHNVVLCNGARMGQEIRTSENSEAASVVSAHPEVRAALLDVQRDIGRRRSSVLEGRDIGTVVFPDADVKVFLTAQPETRARRRVEQLAEKTGVEPSYDAVLAEIRQRDERDATRSTAPLRKAADAMEIDSTSSTIDDVVETILVAARAVR